MIRIVTQRGNQIRNGIEDILRRIKDTLKNQSGKVMANAMMYTTQNHFRTIYPNSKHYSPNKVSIDKARNNTGIVDVNVPGVTRAYHDLIITPKRAKSLTIPIHKASYGKRAREFNDLFVIKTKSKAFLAQQESKGKIRFLYLLSKGVFQKQDERLMPDDDTFRTNIFYRLKSMLSSTIKKVATQI